MYIDVNLDGDETCIASQCNGHFSGHFLHSNALHQLPLTNLMLTCGLAATDANLIIYVTNIAICKCFSCHMEHAIPPFMFRNLKFKMKCSACFFQKKVPHKTWSGRGESFPPPRSFFDFGKSDDPRKPKRKSSMEKLLLMCYLIRWFVYNF